MNSSVRMQAVIEAPYAQGESSCPWETPQFESFSRVRLFGGMAYPQIGLVFAQLAQYNQVRLVSNAQVVLKQILEAENLVLPGGIQVSEDKKTIYPSCCCGLETWREWIDFLKTGRSPWLGHDPSPWLEMQGDMIRIWSDGGIEPTNNAFHIDVSRSHLKEALKLVEQDLQAFLFRVDNWAQELSFEQSESLVQKFDQCFKISGHYTNLN